VQSAMARYLMTVAPDLRGHGQSVLDEGDMGISSMAADIVAIMDELTLSSAHIAGCSHGAVIALHLARTYPDRIASIIVTSVPDINDPDIVEYGKKYANSVYPKLEPGLDKIHGMGRTGYARERLLTTFSASLDDPPLDHRDALRKASEINCPALILGGDSDPVMSPERAVKLMRSIPNSSLGILPETGHLAHQEAPAMYADAILDHIWRM
jgi:pimeloyl-ACP methyl ester carboxylesterase